MKQEALKYFTDTHLTLIAMLIFFATFLGFIIWSMSVRKAHIQKLAYLPLNEDEIHERK